MALLWYVSLPMCNCICMLQLDCVMGSMCALMKLHEKDVFPISSYMVMVVMTLLLMLPDYNA